MSKLKIVNLVRVEETESRTRGLMLMDEEILCCMVERPWENNEPNISCIPSGAYRVTRFTSPKHGACFLLHGVPGRTMIEIHIANTADELLGCMAPGLKFGKVGGVDGVQSSGSAMNILLEKLPEEFFLAISSVKGVS